MKSSIRTHLNLMVVALVVPTAALLAYNVVREAQDAVAQSKASLRTLASILANTAEAKFAATRQPLTWLASLPTVQAMDASQCADALHMVRALNPQFVNVFYTDGQPRMICAATPLPQDMGAGSSPWFPPMQATSDFNVGPVVRDPQTQRWISVVSKPVRGDAQQVLGAVHLVVDLATLDPGIPKDQLPPGSRYGFFDAEGVMVWRNEDPEKVIGTRPDAEAARRIVAVHDGEFDSLAIDGVVRHFSVVPVPSLGWVAFVGVPLDSVYAPARQRAWTGAGAGGAVLLVLLAIAFALARRIGRPIQALAQAAHALGAQDYGVRVTPSGPSEMVTLAHEFNAMAQAHQLALGRLQLAASVFSHAREAIVITDAQAAILDVNDTFTRITGYRRDEVLGKNPRMLRSGHHDKDFYAQMWSDLTGKGHWSGEFWNRGKGGEIYVEMCTISAVRDDAGVTQNYVALFSDITSLKKYQDELEHIAHYDALTGLPNRLLLADRLRQGMLQSQRRGQQLALVFLDLDGFKAVNDQYGHDMGDQLLIALGQRMKQVLREGDTLARMGGDEFVAVLVDLEQSGGCDLVLERMLRAAAEPVIVGNTTLQVSASIGVAFFPQDGTQVELLLRRADQAMYQAKQNGRNRWCRFDAADDSDGASERSDFARL